MEVTGRLHAQAALLPSRCSNPCCPLDNRLGEPQSRLGTVEQRKSKSAGFSVVTARNSKTSRCFGRIYQVHPQGRRISETGNQRKAGGKREESLVPAEKIPDSTAYQSPPLFIECVYVFRMRSEEAQDQLHRLPYLYARGSNFCFDQPLR
jgi:hypothetical protein